MPWLSAHRVSRAVTGVAWGMTLALAIPAAAAAALTRVSTDPYTNSSSQHSTEVEPDTFSSGSTTVGAFQVGRFTDGGASNIGWARSTDGTTWTNGFLPGTTPQSTPVGAYSRVSDPSVAHDARHGVWLIASLALSSTPHGAAVLVSRSSDGGSTWASPVTVATAAGAADLDKTWIACDNTSTSPHYGNCYTAWDDSGDGDRLKMSTSSDGGATWGAALNTSGNATGLGGQPVVQPNGDVIVPAASASVDAIIAFKSADGGASWSAPVQISPVSWLAEPGGLRTAALPSAEIDGAGRVYVAWEDCRFRAPCTSNDIVFSRSDDGVSWSAPARVPIDAVTSGADYFLPGLGVDRTTSGSGGRLGLTYYYYVSAGCSASTCELDVGFISSTDGGTTWSAPSQVGGPMKVTWLADTTQGSMVGDYISTSFTGDGVPRTIFAQAAARSGSVFDEAMYSPSLTIGSQQPPPPPAAPQESTPTPQAPPPPPSSPPPLPGVNGLTLVPRTFVAASAGPSIAVAPGTTVGYLAVAPATTTFRVEKPVAGRRSAGRCVKPTRRNAKRRRCTRWVRLRGSFRHRDAAGLNRFRFTGRLAKRKLAPGRYRLAALPRDDLGRLGKVARARFRILRVARAVRTAR